MSEPTSATARPDESSWAGAAALVAVALAVYWPALGGGWLWDDNVDITDNPLLRDVRGLVKIWFAPTTFDYYPLKFTVQWLQWQLWGDNVTCYHLTNVLLHAAGAILLWRVFARIGLHHAWLGALVFVTHPLAVESVAWIAELKNVLALPPLLLALLAWLDFADTGRRRDYVRALAWFAAAMLCKSAVVMFPVTLVIVTWWRHGRISRSDAPAFAPFFLISLVLGLVTVWLQQTRALDDRTLALGGVGPRLALAGSSLAFYTWKAIWPADLLPVYPPWRIDPPALGQFVPWLALGLLAAWAWRRRTTWGKHALLGGGWFILHLLPFVGWVPISFMRFTWVMDHLAYFALPGLIGLGFASLPTLRWQGPVRVGALALTLGLAVMARQDAARYRNPVEFWRHALAGYPESWLARNNLGRALAEAGDWPQALAEFERSLQLNPANVEAWLNLGNTLRKLGRTAESITRLQGAVRLKPNLAAAHYHLALALEAAGRRDEAQAGFVRTLELDPTFSEGLGRRGAQLSQAGRHAEAQQAFATALKNNPNSAQIHHDLAMSLRATGQTAAALEHLAAAQRLNPTSPEAHNNYAAALVGAGRPSEALPHLERAAALRPGFIEALMNLGLVRLQLGREREAIEPFEAVLRHDPQSVRAHYNLARALTATGRTADGVAHYEKALQAEPNRPEIHVKLAEALAATGKKAEAVTHYAEARRLNPALPEREF